MAVPIPPPTPLSNPVSNPVPAASFPGRRARAVATMRRPSPWIWLLALLAAAPVPWHQLHLHGDVLVDLHVYRQAGVSLLHHRPVYAEYVNTRYSLLPFTYPPPAAVFAVPLALFPLRLDGLFWFVAIYAVLIWVVRLLFGPVARDLAARRPRLGPWLLPAAFVGCSYLLPVHEQFRFGQVGMFLLGLVLLDLLTPRTGRYRGVLTGLATAIKLTPGVYVVALALARRWREAGMVVAGFLGVVALTWAVAPGTSTAYWTDQLFHSDRLGNNADPANQSLRGVLLRARLEGLPGSVVLGLAILVVGAAGLLVSTRAWRRGDELLAVTMVGLLSCLLSPVAWTHHYVYLLPLLALLLRERRYLWTVVLSYQWAFDWAERDAAHLGQGGVSGALWQLLGNEFVISATVVVMAYAVAELRALRRVPVSPPAPIAGVRVPVRT